MEWRRGGIMSSDLSETTRQLLPARGGEDADTHSPPPVSGTAANINSSTINSGGLQATPQSTTTSSTSPPNCCREEQVKSGLGSMAGVVNRGVCARPVPNTYRLTPHLRDAFASVGATDRVYLFREVMIPIWEPPCLIIQKAS